MTAFGNTTTLRLENLVLWPVGGTNLWKLVESFMGGGDLHAIVDEWQLLYNLCVLISVPVGFVFTDIWCLNSCRCNSRETVV